jgi:hypothetical protein
MQWIIFKMWMIEAILSSCHDWNGTSACPYLTLDSYFSKWTKKNPPLNLTLSGDFIYSIETEETISIIFSALSDTERAFVSVVNFTPPIPTVTSNTSSSSLEIIT